jgi:excisionase family DNA binding protein
LPPPSHHAASASERAGSGRTLVARAPVPRLALSKTEAAEALGVSVDFLEQHAMHELRIARRGRRRLIPVTELDHWIERNAQRTLGDLQQSVRETRLGSVKADDSANQRRHRDPARPELSVAARRALLLQPVFSGSGVERRRQAAGP